MSKKLHYFHLNGLAESIRYILHYTGQKFEDIRYDRSKWPIQAVKEALPYGQLPLYEEDGRSLNQSIAIARYVATNTQLLPSDPWQQALLDATVLNIYDFWSKLKPIALEKDAAKKQASMKDAQETIVYYFSKFEIQINDNNGCFGGKLSWADFVFLGILETTNLFLGIEAEKKYPLIKALVHKLRNLPGVKEYIAGRKLYST